MPAAILAIAGLKMGLDGTWAGWRPKTIFAQSKREDKGRRDPDDEPLDPRSQPGVVRLENFSRGFSHWRSATRWLSVFSLRSRRRPSQPSAEMGMRLRGECDGAQSCQWVSPAMLDGLGQAARRDTAVPARLLRHARGWQRWLPEAMFRWQVLDGDASTFNVVTQ